MRSMVRIFEASRPRAERSSRIGSKIFENRIPLSNLLQRPAKVTFRSIALLKRGTIPFQRLAFGASDTSLLAAEA